MVKKYKSTDFSNSVKMITGAIGKTIDTRIGNQHSKNSDKINLKNTFKIGRLEGIDYTDLICGMQILERLLGEGQRVLDEKIFSGEGNVPKFIKAIKQYEPMLKDFMRRAAKEAFISNEIDAELGKIDEYSKILQAVRDGKITKIEEQDGKKTEIVMEPGEVNDLLRQYRRLSDQIKTNRINNYLGIGLSIAGILGAIGNPLSVTRETAKLKGNSIAVGGTLAVAMANLIQDMVKNTDLREKKCDEKFNQRGMVKDICSNEQISESDRMHKIDEIRKSGERELSLSRKIENSIFRDSLIIDAIVAMISGAIINKNLPQPEKGKIDAKKLAQILVKLQSYSGIAKNFSNTMQGIRDLRESNEELDIIADKVYAVLAQIEEKVDSLTSPKGQFDSVKIENLEGKFYPKQNFETGQKEYGAKLDIPEFSMKRGDVVLISGNSGSGKSTFFRLLKRGDCENKSCLELSTGEKVDNLEKQYITFNPGLGLGNETNLLFQLTGKKHISELTEEEVLQVETIMKELELQVKDGFSGTEKRRISEYSTGEQKRFSLLKVLYSIDGKVPVVIVDEPVGNVQDDLIEKELELIIKYAQKANVMLLMTTHRTELAEKVATKRYHIENGRMEQVPVRKPKDSRINESSTGEIDR